MNRNDLIRKRNSFYHQDPDTQKESTPDVVVLFYKGGRKGYLKSNLNLYYTIRRNMLKSRHSQD